MIRITTLRNLRIATLLFMCTLLSACVGTVVGAVADTAIEVIKVPFKVGGAIIDVVTPDGDDFTDEAQLQMGPSHSNHQASGIDDAAVRMEQEGLQ